MQSELLSRRLAYLCCKKLAQLVNSSEQSSILSPNSPALNNMSTTANSGNPNTPGFVIGTNSAANTNSGPANNTPSSNTNNNNAPATLMPANTVQYPFSEYLNCPHHRDIVLSLSAIIQAITLECPTALVWNCIGEGKSPSVLNGSPLDHLPCSPAQLPMPQRASNLHLKSQLKWGEDLIRQRSLAAEGRWSCDKWDQTSSGQTVNKILGVLDALDRHSFERVDANNSLDTLYSKVFLPPGTKDNVQSADETPNKHDYTIHQDEAVVHILCEWAVSGLRFGEHRAIAVAKLLEKRQNEVTAGSSSNDTEPGDDKDSVSSMPTGLPVFQPLLMKFLDQDAPTDENKTNFMNLVHLFAELIRHEVFSHDAYMCTLISRGDLPSSGGNNVTTHPTSNKPADTPMDEFDLKPSKIEPQEHRGGHMDDDSKIDDDLDKLLQHIKEEQQNSMDAPDSPKDVTGSLVGGIVLNGDQNQSQEGGDKFKQSRHQLYTKHFPIPQDESYYHDCNQRLVLLYGVGRERDNARHNVKKMTKELCKLFTKKFCIDVADGGKVKKHSRSEFNFDQQHLSFFDQHYMTWQCSLTVLEMIQSFALGNSNYLPVQVST